LAAQPGLSASPFALYERNNVVATHRLIESARGSDTLRAFIHVSSSSVYGSEATGPEDAEPKPTSYYGVTKLAAEQLVLAQWRAGGFPACAFRLFSVYGPRERPDKLFPTLIRSILDGTPFPLFEGSESHLRSYTFVSDIVDGLVAPIDRLQTCKGEIFNLGTREAITTGEGIRIVEELMGRRAEVVRRVQRSGDQANTCANVEKARRMLGYEPRTSPRDGLERMIRWYLSARTE
jgi:UDP-glucuronate 4-epimerase